MPRRTTTRAARLGAAAFLAAAAGCGDSAGPPPPPASMQAVAGAGQQATVGTTVPVAPVIQVLNTEGNPSEGVVVTFTVIQGGGTITGPVDTTDVQGRVQVESWTLGTTAGPNLLSATTSGGLSTTVTATALPGQPISLEPRDGNAQIGEVGQALPIAPSVLVRDAFGNPVPGVSVRFTVVGSSGTVATTNAVTDASGIASAGVWTLGPEVGTQRVTASLPSGTAVSFTATAEPGDPAALEKVAGDNQTSAAGAAVPIPPSVRVVDAFGNALGGIQVTFAVGTGGGTVTGGSLTTDQQGIARVGSWELGDVIGTQTLIATAPDLPPVTFTATAVASAFAIEVRFGGAPSGRTQQAVAGGAARWQDVIVGDIPDANVSVPANACIPPQLAHLEHPAVNEIVDDVLILAVIDSIDGPSGILGGAIVCRIRSSSNTGLTSLGLMVFDSADVAGLEANGTIDDVMLHEMGHVLGIGSLWSQFGVLVGAGTNDPWFNGQNAIDRFQTAGGSHPNGVPVENTGQPGTRDSHWRDSVLGNELMTGFISGTNNPLSAITIGSLHDMGYIVDYGAADAFSLSAASVAAALAAPGFHLREFIIPPRR